MSADKHRILAGITELLGAVSESVLPGEEITMATRLVEDLELQSLTLVNLSGRIQARYGAECNLVPFFAARTAGSFTGLRVGELVDYVVDVLAHTATPLAPVAAVQPVDAQIGHAARNDNAGVLAELAPRAIRSIVRLPGGEVEVFIAGDGPPLVLMHPLNVGAGVFARQFANLAGQYRVICLHNPGVGATTWAADVTLTGIARLQRAVLAALNVEPPFHVLGSSFGGLLAQQFALLHPAECSSLILVGCSYQAGARPELRKLQAIAEEEFGRIHARGGDLSMPGTRAELEDLLLRCESMDIGIAMKYLDGFASRPSLFPQLPTITTPTLILRGRHDTMVPAKHAHLLYGAIPDAQLEELPDAGHFPCLTHPAETNRHIEPFLAAHPMPAPPVIRTSPAFAPAVPAPPDPCAIILSTGRCGSTLLSTLVAEEPETMSASETLMTLRSHLSLMPLTRLTGAEYWSLLSDPGIAGALATRLGITPREIRYPAHGRFGAGLATIPPILTITLPGITSDPDLLFSILAEKVPQFPDQPVGQHHKLLLNLMASLTGKRRWIERSGASSAMAQPLLEAFPEARVVYLTRDIADTARSMSQHPAFQLTLASYEFHARYGTDPYVSWLPQDRLPSPNDMPEDVRRLLPDHLTAATLHELGQDTARFEAMCTHMMGSAEQALADVKPEHLHRIRYEAMQADPQGELTTLGEFLGFADPSGWATATASRVRPAHVTAAH